MSGAFVGIHDKTPDMRILYVSSGVQPVLNYCQEEMIGREVQLFMLPDEKDKYQLAFGPLSQENIGLFYTSIKRHNGDYVFIRIIHFDCDGVGLNACFVTDPAEHSAGLANSLQVTANGGPGPNSGPQRVLTNSSLGNGALNIARVIARRNAADAQSSSADIGRSPTRRACLIIDKVTDPREYNTMGPRIIFASNSLSRITNIDACDIQGTPFMSLVPPEDVTKTARFLEQVSKSNDVVIDCLQLAVFDGNHESMADYRRSLVAPRTIDVEVMAAGSEDGIILLCQQIRSGRMLPNGTFDSEGYLSLEEIISSDAESSDLPSNWTSTLC
ncbi:hypothetical protein IW140_004729 [Coemansia sp. RSA 1813]|nr:hypothetical protein EV178_004057 [Coemansia sp. RSA 1646]KAJ1770416.1 hypothetical protein LPJ74_003223 [Coemansia sp. RSA 1843]KAJ2088232.1 hypothetical protein IW138_004404 [Coemansia sp. RSA 986]KAJ2215726.1 hypothetical protein EV179_001950 [Coemansia sp. RSA 487]KAJ2566938.1 hypothetical protein IW140_004729 [Coemansia sp. RSA 1813]